MLRGSFLPVERTGGVQVGSQSTARRSMSSAFRAAASSDHLVPTVFELMIRISTAPVAVSCSSQITKA